MRFKLTWSLVLALAAVAFSTAACQQNTPTTVTTNATANQNGSANSAGSSSAANKADGEQAKNSAAAPKVDEHGHADDAPRISLTEAKKDFDAGSVVFVDTRAESAFRQEHIKGAINVPMEAFEARYKDIPTGGGKKIVAYCS